MRPPANIISQWIREKNSFPVRGLVMLRAPKTGWLCNIEIIRMQANEIDDQPVEKAAFEIALSAIFRYITSSVYNGESELVVTPRGTELLVPTIAFEMAPFLVEKIKKIITDGGGAINVNQVAVSRKFLAFSKTGSVLEAESYGLPKIILGADRISHRLEYEAKLTYRQAKAMANRRKHLARHWLNHVKRSFYRRGLVFSSDTHGLWTFNAGSGEERLEHTSTDHQALEQLAYAVSLNAVNMYMQAVNVERGGQTVLDGKDVDDEQLSPMIPDFVSNAARRVCAKLLKLMKKNQHGVLSLKTIESALVLEWDLEDEKPLDDYPFPRAPTIDFHKLDQEAMDRIGKAHARNRAPLLAREALPDTIAASAQAEQQASASWRQELEIDDWVPLDEIEEDDETLDRKALAKADHDQSAALRRIRGAAGGRVVREDIASPVKHKVDYAGLPKDVD